MITIYKTNDAYIIQNRYYNNYRVYYNSYKNQAPSWVKVVEINDLVETMKALDGIGYVFTE